MYLLINNFYHLSCQLIKGGGDCTSNHKSFKHIFCNYLNFVLTSVQVILVPYCCLFSVLSSDVLNVSRGTFS